jgi:hypothetical protein
MRHPRAGLAAALLHWQRVLLDSVQAPAPSRFFDSAGRR